MEYVIIGNAGRACMDSVDEVKPHPNTGMPRSDEVLLRLTYPLVQTKFYFV